MLLRVVLKKVLFINKHSMIYSHNFFFFLIGILHRCKLYIPLNKEEAQLF